MFINNNLLKLFYSALLTGLPPISYNAINQNTLHAPFIVNEGSTYINYKLDNEQFNKINNHLSKKTNNLKSKAINIFNNKKKSKLIEKNNLFLENNYKYEIDKDNDEDKNKHYYLSINIYNCSSPIFNFLSKDPVTRCEINTYVVNKKNEIGTLIMDYTSNILSVDPDNIFKKSCPTKFSKDLSNNVLSCFAYSDNIIFELEYDYKNIVSQEKISEEMIKYTDKIFYNNGIYDKLYYDSSLLHNKLLIPRYFDIHFNFMGIEFNNPESVFFFKDQLNFVGGMWDNLHNL